MKFEEKSDEVLREELLAFLRSLIWAFAASRGMDNPFLTIAQEKLESLFQEVVAEDSALVELEDKIVEWAHADFLNMERRIRKDK